MLTLTIIHLSGIILLWVISLISTITDGKKGLAADASPWTKTGLAAAVLTTLLSFGLLALTAATSYSAFAFNKINGDQKKYRTALAPRRHPRF